RKVAGDADRRNYSVPAPRPDEAQLLYVSGDGGLRGCEAALGQRLDEVELGFDGPLAYQLEDGPLPVLLQYSTLPAGVLARFIAATARSISSADITSGGTRRTVSSSTALTTPPAARQRHWNSLATGVSKPTACISPLPRTVFTPSSPRR